MTRSPMRKPRAPWSSPASRSGDAGWSGVLDRFPELGNTFVTIDIDGLDPSIAPGTGSPTVDGLLYHEVRGAAARRDQVAAKSSASISSR